MGVKLDIKKVLHEYPYIEDEIKKLNNKLNWIVHNKYDIKVTSSNSIMPKGNMVADPIYQTVERIIIKYDKEIHEIEKEIEMLLDQHRMIEIELKRLDIDECQVIEHRYFKRLGWEELSRKLHYSKRQCHRKHDTALKQLREGLGDEKV